MLTVPFGPMAIGSREPVEALLDHLGGIGAVGIVLVRGGAHSVGVARDGAVLSSSTDRAYLQGRTAAGGWSQQRFARRRAINAPRPTTAPRRPRRGCCVPVASSLTGLVLGGDRRGLADVLADSRLAGLAASAGPHLPGHRRAAAGGPG